MDNLLSGLNQAGTGSNLDVSKLLTIIKLLPILQKLSGGQAAQQGGTSGGLLNALGKILGGGNAASQAQSNSAAQQAVRQAVAPKQNLYGGSTQKDPGFNYTGLAGALGKPILSQGLSEVASQLGLGGGGGSLTGLAGGLTSSLGSFLPSLMGKDSSPALSWMGSSLGSLGSQALTNTGYFSPLYQAISGWGGGMGGVGAPVSSMAAAGLAPAATTMGQAGTNLAATGLAPTLGSVLGQAAPILPILQMVSGGGEAQFASPYANYAASIPLFGGVIGSIIDIATGAPSKQRGKISEAIGQTYRPGADRYKQMKDAGMTDYDIYAYAKMHGLAVVQGAGEDTIAGVFTGPEYNQYMTAQQAWSPSLDSAIRWEGIDKKTGEAKWTSYPGLSSSNTALLQSMDAANLPADYWNPVTTSEPPSTGLKPDTLLGSPRRAGIVAKRQFPSWTEDPYNPSYFPGGWPGMAPPPPVEQVSWEQAYGQSKHGMFGEGEAPRQTLSEFLNSNEVALYDWVATHPDQPLPEGVTAPKISENLWTKTITNPEWDAAKQEKADKAAAAWESQYGGIDWSNIMSNAWGPVTMPTYSGFTYNVPKTLTLNYWSLSPEEQAKWNELEDITTV